MQVYNNVTAFGVWSNYTSNVSSLRKSMGKLASGLKINTAGDDPAGLAMSERLRTQYRNSAAAASNIENKINYLQTADSWLQKIHDMTGRMAELAIMANDGTKSRPTAIICRRNSSRCRRRSSVVTSGATAAAVQRALSLQRRVRRCSHDR